MRVTVSGSWHFSHAGGSSVVRKKMCIRGVCVCACQSVVGIKLLQKTRKVKARTEVECRGSQRARSGAKRLYAATRCHL